MSRSKPLIALIALAAAAALLVSPGCTTTAPESSQPPPSVATVPAPTVKAGAFWEYAVRDAYTGLPRGLYRYTVSGIEGDKVFIEVTHEGRAVDAQVYTRDWKGLEHPLRNLQRFRYSPPLPAYAFPLYAGQTWRAVVSSTDAATGRSYRTHVHASVRGWRRITVPAGEFDAIEVRRRIYAGNAESFALQEEIDEIDWYAPSIGQVIVSQGSSSHIDTSRSGGGRGRPLRVRGDALIAELVRYSS
jgi:hypothetical protein